jgi:hypothetical protein
MLRQRFARAALAASLIASASLWAASVTPAYAEDVAVPAAAPAKSGDRPANGMHMAAVEAKYGAPAARHDAVGQPPITRWDYADMVLFFENDLLIHAVLLHPQA